MVNSESTHEADSRAFRACVGKFATGVTVVAACRDGEYAGMTLNSFASVSLDPLMVCVSLAHDSRTLSVVRRADRFAVSVLCADQRHVAQTFATPGLEFPHALTRSADDDHVYVDGALAVVRCDVEQLVAAGDHDLVLGRVTRFESRDGAPLVFHRGSYAALLPSAAT